MSRLRRPVALLLVLVALAVAVGTDTAGASDGGSGAPTDGVGDREPRRVLVLTAPRLTWERLRDGRAPNLTDFLDRAAVASLSTRTIGPVTDPGQAYLTIGAGNRSDNGDPATDGQAADRDEVTAVGPAADVYERRTGLPADAEVLALTFPEQVTRNRGLLYGARPGSLASALGSAGIGTAVVANADQPGRSGPAAGPVNRQAALAAVDRTGRADAGRVGPELVSADPSAPFGLRLDEDAVVAAVTRAWGTSRMAVVELSDLERAEQARAQSTPVQGDRQFDRALRRSDRLAGRVLATVDPTRDLVLVLAPTSPLEGEQLTVFGMAGPGTEPGWARSGSTRRDGFVTLTDVAATVVRAFGAEVPTGMNDTPIAAVPDAGAPEDRTATMVRDSERAVFRDSATGPVTVSFIVLLVLYLAAVAWCLARAPGWARAMRFGALLVMSVPSAMFLSGLLPYGPFAVATFGLAVLAIAALVAGGSALVGRRAPLLAAMGPAVTAVVVLAVDIVTGGNLQLSTMFGYSPIVAGRFAGYGNQAFAILSISSLVVATAGWEEWARRRPDSSNARRVVVVVAFFAVVVVLDGAPMLGSDVGGVLAMTPAFAVCTLLLAGVRVRPRLLALVGVATVALLAAFAAVDLARPVASRTHLGRFAQQVLDGGALTILERKVQANLNVLTSTVWTIVIPVALLFLAYLTWRPNRALQQVNARHPGFRAFGISAITLGVLGWAVNDSGVAIPAMMLTVALPYVAYLVLETLLPRPAGTP